MKKWPFIAGGLIAVSLGLTLFLPRLHETWNVERAEGLVLSLKETSESGSPAILQIRCGDETAEVRLYIPIRVTPPVGPARGPAMVDLVEEFRDKNNKIVSADSGDARPLRWTVADDGSYAFRTDALAFIGQLASRDWLYVRSVGFYGDQLAAATKRFAVMGFGEHKDEVASACHTAH